MNARLAMAIAMLEDDLQETVRSMCADLGLAVQHIHDPRRSWLPGWPDLTIIGRGEYYDELVRLAHELRVETSVLAINPSKSRPDRGLVSFQTDTLNQHGELRQRSVSKLLIFRRSPSLAL